MPVMYNLKMCPDWLRLRKVIPWLPENIPIGTIDKVYIDDQTNYYTLNVRLLNDMTNLGYVYVIENKDREEILELEAATNNE